MTEFHNGLSRRAILKAGASLAAAGFAMPALSAFGQGTNGGKVRFGVTKPWADAIAEPLARFQSETGITVEIVPLTGGSGVELIQQFTPGFMASRPAVDLMNISDEATPGFARAGWLEPLEQIATEEWWSDFSQFVRDYSGTWSSRDGHLYRLPTSFSTCFYYARTDVLAELGVEAPKTWDEINGLTEAAKSRNMAAFADALRKPALAAVGAAWLSLQSGGDLFAFDPGTKTAFEFAKSLIDGGALPRQSLGWSYDELNAAYTGDTVLTMRQWNSFLAVSAGKGYEGWYNPEKVVVVPPPAAANGAPASYGGGWGLAVPAKAENKDSALVLAAWLTDTANAAELRAKTAQFSPPRVSTMAANPDDVYFKALQGYIDGGYMRPRPFHSKIIEAQGIVDDMFNGYLAGQMNIDAAMENGAKQITALG